MAIELLDLVERNVTLRRAAINRKYSSAEYVGPCPFCGGTDRFHVWPDYKGGRWACMREHCGRSGDAIQYLREQGMSYHQACAHLGMSPGERPTTESAEPAMPSLELEPPSDAWQKTSLQFCKSAFTRLCGDQGADMRTYLHNRGLKDESIQSAKLGLYFGDEYVPAGLVIPGLVSGVIWQINIRTGGNPNYRAKRNSVRPLYQADLLTRDKPAMLVESELDALLLLQEAGDLVTPVATCGTQGARHLHWMLQLCTPRQVLISTDADEAGDTAADWWLAHLPTALRWRPLAKDPTDIHRLGLGLRDWVADAVEWLNPPKPKLRVITGNLAAVRKLSMDPQTQPRLEVLKPTLQPLSVALSERAYALLECLPVKARGWNVSQEAAQAYVTANEPAYAVNFWGRSIQSYKNKPLWTQIGQALATGGKPASAALDIMSRMRRAR